LLIILASSSIPVISTAMRRFSFATILLSGALAGSFAGAADQPQPPANGGPIKDPEAAQQYQHCILLARTNPDEGWHEGLAWASLGGGEAALHCQAVALIGKKEYEDAAGKLEILARDSHASARIRAGMLAQAGQAWLLARQPDRAFTDQSAALALVPGAPDLLVDRAESQADQKDYEGALRDLNEALIAAPDRVDALTFRATAKRYVGDMAGAKADILRALTLDEHYQDAWLEDGIEKHTENDDDGARRSWSNVLSLAPQSDAAVTAKRDLEVLDSEKDGVLEQPQ
jgi:tetratricopeptide (TPR) repeat protein